MNKRQYDRGIEIQKEIKSIENLIHELRWCDACCKTYIHKRQVVNDMIEILKKYVNELKEDFKKL